MPVCRIFLNVGSNVATRLAYSSMRNEEFPERKTDEKNEKGCVALPDTNSEKIFYTNSAKIFLLKIA